MKIRIPGGLAAIAAVAAMSVMTPTAVGASTVAPSMVRTQGAFPTKALQLQNVGTAQVAPSTPDSVESEDEEYDGDLPEVEAFEPFTIEQDTLGSKDGIKAALALPGDCSFGSTAGTIKCGYGSGTYDPSVVDAEGNDVPYREKSAGKTITLEVVPKVGTPFPLTVTAFIGEAFTDEDGKNVTEIAADSLGDMVSGDESTDPSEAELEKEEADLEKDLAESDPEAEETAKPRWPTRIEPLPARKPSAEPSPQSGLEAQRAGRKSSKVTIPKSYRYCPRTCKPKSLHDYCTAPTSRPVVGKYRADFRGPCARHDMSIDATRKKKISNGAKYRRWYAANETFGARLGQQCRYQFKAWSTFRQNCYVTGSIFFGAVTANTVKKQLLNEKVR